MNNDLLKKGWLGLTFLIMALNVYLIIFYAPLAMRMGVDQKILYLMVPFAWLALLSYLIIFVASIAYLSKRTRKWDIIGHSAAEIGLLATTCTLAVGILWTKPEWGVWWTWEPRLTATLILWFIYIAYLMVRSFATEESVGARFAAVVGIIGFVDVPIIGMSTTIWRTLHPPLLIFEKGGMAPSMLHTLIVSLIAFTSLYLILLVTRINIRNQENELIELKNATDRS